MTAPINDKTWATLRARAAMQGLTLTRTDPADGPVVYFLERRGLVQPVTPDDLAQRVNVVPGGG